MTMRSIQWILFGALLALWLYFLIVVAPQPSGRPVPLPERSDVISAATLNNRAVALSRRGREADAVAFLERAHELRPHDEVIEANLRRQRARVVEAGWQHALGAGAGVFVLLVLWRGVHGAFAGACDRRRLRRLRLRGDPYVYIDSKARKAELSLRFNEPVAPLLRRNPLTIVWSSTRHGKHMKSRPKPSPRGSSLRVPLKGHRLEQLRRYPGDWKAFLYLGKTAVGQAAARVG